MSPGWWIILTAWKILHHYNTYESDSRVIVLVEMSDKREKRMHLSWMYPFFLCHLLISPLFLGLISAVVLTETKKSWMWPSRSCLHIPSSDSLNQILTDQWKMHLSFTILASCIDMQEAVFWKLYKDSVKKIYSEYNEKNSPYCPQAATITF